VKKIKLLVVLTMMSIQISIRSGSPIITDDDSDGLESPIYSRRRLVRPESPIITDDSDDDLELPIQPIVRPGTTRRSPILDVIHGNGPRRPTVRPGPLKDIEDEPTTIPELECKICVTNKQCVAITKCGHVFCKSCVLKCKVCPTCRIRYSPNDLLRLFM